MRLFVSYASQDAVRAEEVSLALIQDGHEVLFDRSLLTPGDAYNRELREAIDRAYWRESGCQLG